MTEHTINWNAANEKWLCLTCLRSSDHISKEDAQNELDQFDCLGPLNPEPKPVESERRQTARKKTSVPAQLVLRGRTVPIRITTIDLSLGGCDIENLFTLHIGAHLTMTLWLGEQRIKIDAIVKTCDPVFGNGIEFLEVAPLERFKLRAYLDSVAAT